MTSIGVIGATGRVGQRVLARFRARGVEPVAIGRNPSKLQAIGLRHGRQVDLADHAGARAALEDLDVVVSCTRPDLLGSVLQCLPDRTARLVALGSTRKFSQVPDPASELVRQAERALTESGRPGLFLHPTMIYGAQAEENVQRMLAWIRRMPVVPLPADSKALVQPVYIDDVAEALVRAAVAEAPGVEPLVVAGPEPMTYAAMVQAVARAFGHRAYVLPVPFALLQAGAAVMRLLPGAPGLTATEICRLRENKAFDIAPLRQRLGLDPLPFAEGLARMREALQASRALP